MKDLTTATACILLAALIVLLFVCVAAFKALIMFGV
jgi:hypothetical protein